LIRRFVATNAGFGTATFVGRLPWIHSEPNPEMRLSLHLSKSVWAQRHLPEIIAAMRACLSDYRIDLGDKVALGFSGGKDSTALLLLLQEMSIAVTPVIVDLGYSNFDAKSVASSCKRLGFDAVVLLARSERTLHKLSPSIRRQVTSNIVSLDSTDIQSPCGPCSQIKRSLLVTFAKRNGLSSVLLGHHRNDFLATILKDYFIARYYAAHGQYSCERFRAFIADDALDTGQLKLMVSCGTAATMAIHMSLEDAVAMVRPMAYVPEESLACLVAEAGVTVFGSGCSHDVFTNSAAEPTKRELVHAELTRRLRTRPELSDQLLAVALESLDVSGRPRCNPRANRHASCPGFTE
jgi:7-cyano-7-deazaguanine synthase in queuosine biosynthesis